MRRPAVLPLVALALLAVAVLLFLVWNWDDVAPRSLRQAAAATATKKASSKSSVKRSALKRWRESMKVVIVGARKCGTTSLLRYLKGVPRVCPEPKAEPALQLPSSKKDREGSLNAFREQAYAGCSWASDELYVLKNAGFFTNESIAGDLKYAFPRAHVVILLRDPVERLYSHWFMETCKGRTQASFEEFYPHNIRTGHYFHHVLAYEEAFGKALHVFKSEDFFANPAAVFELLTDRARIPLAGYVPDYLVHSSSVECTSAMGPRAPMKYVTRQLLQQYYAPLNERLREHMKWQYAWQYSLL